MDPSAFGLPTTFGKSVGAEKKQKNALSSRVAQTKRREDSEAGSSKLEEPSTAGPGQAEEAAAQESVNENEDKSERNGGRVEEDEEAEAEFDGGEEEEADELPISHEVLMKDHTKAVSALSLDPSGARLASGAYDYDVKLWDFGGMDAGFRPFRSWEPVGSYQIHDLQWSNSGDSFLLISGTWQPKLYDRDAQPIGEFAKGDMYLRDLKNTSGHVAELTSGAWHPKDANTFITSSNDTTVRIWDVANRQKSKSVIVVKSKERGGRTKVTTAAYSKDGKQIACAGLDGTIHLWATNSNFARPSSTVEKAHEKNTETSALSYSVDGRTLVSRGGDDTVKLWDIRSFRKPLATRTNLPVLHPETNLTFSPDERYIVTGTAGYGLPSSDAQDGEGDGVTALRTASGAIEPGTKGKIVVMRKSDLEIVRTLSVSPASVIRVIWHPRINQILTGSADGSIHVLYSPRTSIRGATLALSKAPRKRAVDDDFSLDRPIITPHALPMFKDDQMGLAAGGRGGKRKRERERQDPVKTMKPTPPMTGPGKGGRVGASATQHIVKGMVRDNTRDEDPREALLKYADKVNQDPQFTSAWTKTQPKAVFDTRGDAEEEAEEEGDQGQGGS